MAGEGSAATAYTDPLWTGAARYVQVTAARTSSRGPSALTDVRLVAIDPTEDGSIGARLTGVARRLAATVAGVSFVPPASAASSAPVIVTRSEWGADESLRSGAPDYAPVKAAIIHHTASGNLYSRGDAPALVRGIYAYHTRSLHWDDIAYNFLVDRFGTIYEGRYGGVTRGVVGAHVYGFNTGTTGVSVIGTFTDDAPPTEALTALERLLAWKLTVHGLDPAGTAQLTLRRHRQVRQGGDGDVARSSPATARPTTRSAPGRRSPRSSHRSGRPSPGAWGPPRAPSRP